MELSWGSETQEIPKYIERILRNPKYIENKPEKLKNNQ
jgi:hypothetical protein